MVKVCHMTDAHGQEDVRIFLKECTSLAQNGYEVYQVSRGTTYDKNGVHLVGVGEISGNRFTRMTKGARAVYQAAKVLDADIYHFHDPELLPYGLKLKKQGKKVIFDSHEDFSEQILDKRWIPLPLRKLVSFLYRWYAAHVVKQLDAVIVVTPTMIDKFERCARKVAMITNYPNLEDISFSRLEEHLSSAEQKVCRLCFAGGIIPQWSHAVIIRTLEQLPDVRYTLIGPVKETYLAELATLPAWNQVDYLGKMSHEQAMGILPSCAVGMAILTPNSNTSKNIGTLGNTKLFEEMMAGIPVVCTDFVLWREIIDKYHCGICVTPDNREEIIAAVRYLADHPEEARQMGKRGRRAVEEEYNWKTQEEKLLDLYANI